jgi:hypothetical protein
MLYLKNQLKDKDEKLEKITKQLNDVAHLFTRLTLHQQETYNLNFAAMHAHIQHQRDEIANLRLMPLMQRSDARESRESLEDPWF